MKEIISGLWFGTKNDLFRKEVQSMVHINCNFNDTFLSNDLQIQLFLEKQSIIVSLIKKYLTNMKNVFIYNSNEHKQLENEQLLVIAFFIKYTDIKISNLLSMISKKINQSILQTQNEETYTTIITKLLNQYR